VGMTRASVGFEVSDRLFDRVDEDDCPIDAGAVYSPDDFWTNSGSCLLSGQWFCEKQNIWTRDNPCQDGFVKVGPESGHGFDPYCCERRIDVKLDRSPSSSNPSASQSSSARVALSPSVSLTTQTADQSSGDIYILIVLLSLFFTCAAVAALVLFHKRPSRLSYTSTLVELASVKEDKDDGDCSCAEDSTLALPSPSQGYGVLSHTDRTACAAQEEGDVDPEILGEVRERYALVVGIDKYQDEAIADLEEAVSDATEMGAALGRLGFEVKTLVDGATKARLKRAVCQLCSGKDRGDLLLFYFAGHGVALGGQKQAALVVQDAALNDVERTLSEGDSWDEVDSVITQRWLVQTLKAASARVVVILDACHQGIKTRCLIRRPDFDLHSQGVALLAASTRTQKATDGGANSYTHVLLQALSLQVRGEDDGLYARATLESGGALGPLKLSHVTGFVDSIFMEWRLSDPTLPQPTRDVRGFGNLVLSDLTPFRVGDVVTYIPSPSCSQLDGAVHRHDGGVTTSINAPSSSSQLLIPIKCHVHDRFLGTTAEEQPSYMYTLRHFNQGNKMVTRASVAALSGVRSRSPHSPGAPAACHSQTGHDDDTILASHHQLRRSRSS